MILPRCLDKPPGDREGSFEPEIVRKGQQRFEGFNGKVNPSFPSMAGDDYPGNPGPPGGDQWVDVSLKLTSHDNQEVRRRPGNGRTDPWKPSIPSCVWMP